MTTINNLTIEQMREIVRGAPVECAYYGLVNNIVIYYQWSEEWFWHNPNTNEYERDFSKSMRFSLNDLRTAIAEHDREFKIGDHIRYIGIDRKSPHPEIFEVVGFDSMPVGGNGYKIKNRLGQIDFCYGDNYALVDCDTTDHVTDIRNHIFPSTKVVDL